MNDVVNNEIKNITLDQLLPGDILGFKGNPDDKVSFLIMQLTNGSDVSHGAIFVQNKDNVLAESGEGGIHSRKMFDAADGREVYVLRHKDAGPNGVEPVVPIAKNYVLQDLPYPYSDLILLGLILLFKKKVTKKIISRPVVEFLCLVAAELKTIIEQQQTSGKHTMVCSSFVYQCYLDASKEYPNLKLNVKDGDVGFKEHFLLGANANQDVSLFDLFDEYVSSHKEEFESGFYANKNLVRATKLRAKEEILADLEKQLLNKENDAVPVLMGGEFSIILDFIKAIKDIVEAMGTLLKGDISFDEMMKNAREQQALFVTPNDLVNHLTNADLIGIAKVRCDNERYDDNFKQG